MLPQNPSFAVSFTHLKFRREYKEDYMKMGESKVGTRPQDSEPDYVPSWVIISKSG